MRNELWEILVYIQVNPLVFFTTYFLILDVCYWSIQQNQFSVDAHHCTTFFQQQEKRNKTTTGGCIDLVGLQLNLGQYHEYEDV